MLQAHGTADVMVALSAATRTRQFLEEAGVQELTFHEYPGMGHAYCEDEFWDVKEWLRTVLPPRDT